MSIRLWAMAFKSLSLLAAFLFFANGETSHNYLIQKIVGGHAVSISDFPYQVSLRDRSRHICGGSLITPSHVLTAAHCFNGYHSTRSSFSVAMGHSRLRASQKLYYMRSFVLHSGYAPYAFPIVNDIAIIKLYSPVRIDGVTVKTISLASKTPDSGTMCVVSGWGALREAEDPNKGAEMSDYLQAVTVPVIGKEKCASVTQVNQSVICAGYSIGGKDSCQGDSGGPMVCGKVLSGIVSYGAGCAHPNSPGVYTDVSFFTDWIRNNTLASSPAPPQGIFALLISAFLVIYLIL